MKKNMLKPTGELNSKSTYVLGVDPSRTGKDESALVILEQLPFDKNIFVTYLEIVNTQKLDILIARVVYLDKFYNFKKIIVDSTGLGGGVEDLLKVELGHKVEGVWYTQKVKVEMFQNLKMLMMKKEGKLYIPDYLQINNAIVKKLYFQFLAITQTYKDGDATRLPKISHDQRTHDDLVNALALAATYFRLIKHTKTYGLNGYSVTK